MAVADTLMAPLAADEALLDVYELQWREIDIRMEKLRCECERMILEYEVEMKEQMFLAECEASVAHTERVHAAERMEMERALAATQEQLRDAREHHRRAEKEQQRQQERKQAAVDKRLADEKRKRAQIEQEAATADRLATRRRARNQTAAASESENGYASSTSERARELSRPARSSAMDDELLQMLSQEPEYESEDFGGTSLILPETHAPKPPARNSGKRTTPVKVRKPRPAATAAVAAREPDEEPTSESDFDIDGAATPPAKRALKRRKMAVDPVNGWQLAVDPAVKKSAAKTKEQRAVTSKARKSVHLVVAENTDGPATAQIGGKKPRAPVGKRTTEATKHKSAVVGKPNAGEQDEGVDVVSAARYSTMQDIATPKAPGKSKNAHIRGKPKATHTQKQIKELAAKREAFQQAIMEDTDAMDSTGGDNEDLAMAHLQNGNISVGKRRRRELQDTTNGLQTPVKKKPKKSKVARGKENRNRFANDELNIMKSPAPRLTRPGPVGKKGKDADDRGKDRVVNGFLVTPHKKRTLSERDDGAESEELDYGNPAQMMPAPTSGSTSTAGTANYADRWLNSGVTARPKKPAAQPAQKSVVKPSAAWGGGTSFFDAFVNAAAPAIPRLKTTKR